MEWIKVSDRLPSIDDYEVLIWSQSGFEKWTGKAKFEPCSALWLPEIQEFETDTKGLYWSYLLNVTHWMPMPKPPTE